MYEKTDQRIQRVIDNLLPSTAFDGKFASPKNLQERMAYYHTPGVSVAVINDFQVEWARGFGVCDTVSNNAVTTETLFQCGSISKAIFALGVMRLVQKDELSLDEDVNRYLSSWRVPANAGWQPKITLRQLLSHTAGLTVHGFPGYQASESVPTVPQILNGGSPSNTAKVEVNILPGTQFRYSGGGATVAQQVVTDVLSKPFPEIMDELVFAPLGLVNSTYTQPLSNEAAKNAATAHAGKSVPVKGRCHIYPEMAAAGLWTTATDLAKVGAELLQVVHDRKLPSLLAREVIEAMLLPQLGQQKAGEFYGLGFSCSGKDKRFCFGHSGRNEGFIADMRIYKNLGKGAVIMVNSNDGSPLIGEIMRAISEEYDWPGERFSVEKKPVKLAATHNYGGFYATKSGLQFRVGAIEDDLLLEYEDQPPLPIYPLSETEFFTPVLNMVVRFRMDDKKGIVGLIMNQKGYEIEADRLAEV